MLLLYIEIKDADFLADFQTMKNLSKLIVALLCMKPYLHPKSCGMARESAPERVMSH